MIQCFENVLTEEEQKYVFDKTVLGNTWSFTGKSNLEDINRIWYMDLNNDPFFTNIMFLKIKKLISEDVELIRIYANGQTHGVCGKLHTDSDLNFKLNQTTFLYYPAFEWDIEWGGFTVFNVDGEVMTRFPYPNSGLYFDADIFHYGSEPTKHCPYLRVSVAFKLDRKNKHENPNRSPQG